LFTKKLSSTAALALLLFGIALGPRIFGLGRGLTTDEAYQWQDRSARFLAAVSKGDFAATLITGHPGVTTMWLGSLGLLGERMLQNPNLPFELHLTLMRLPVACATSLAIVLGFWLLQQSGGLKLAFSSAFLWATDPFLVAHSRLLHVDALLTMLMLLAQLALIAACFPAKSKATVPKFSLLLLAGAATGLAQVSKASAALLIPSGFLILFTWYWPKRQQPKALRQLILAVGVWGGMALVTAFGAWPAFWVAPAAAIGKVVNEVLGNGGEPQKGNFLLGQSYISTEPGALFYPVTLFARATPWVVVGLSAFIWAIFARWERIKHQKNVFFLISASSLLIILALTLVPKKFDRYALPAVPLLQILAATGLLWLHAKIPARAQRTATLASSGAAVAVLMWYHPYYLAYYNPLLGGGAQAAKVVPVGWGEGLDQAAAWLNAQPDLAEGEVATWSPPTLQSYLQAKTTWQSGILSGKVQYLVVYLNQIQNQKETHLFQPFYLRCNPVKIIKIHEIEYAWIYRVPKFAKSELEVRFGQTLALKPREFVPPDPCSCRPKVITLTLNLKSLTRPVGTNFLFLHLNGPTGQMVSQLDLPLEALWPAEKWAPGQTVNYPFALPLPATASPGTYEVVVGIYEPKTGQRLALEAPVNSAPDSLRAVTFELGASAICKP